MNRTDGGRRQEFQRKVPVGDGIHSIRHRPVEAEKLRRHLAVGRKAGTGKRGGAKRRFVHASARVGVPAPIPADHLDISEEMMPKRHRLCRLQMGEARHHRVGVLLGRFDQCALQVLQLAVDGVDGGPGPETEIGCDLIVSTAPRVQPAGGLPDLFR